MRLFLICLISLTITTISCSQDRGIENEESLSHYTENLKSSSVNNIKKTIRKDTILLNSLLRSISKERSQTYVMSLESNGEINKPVSKFELENYSIKEIEPNFYKYCNELYFRNFSYSVYSEKFSIESNYIGKDLFLEKFKNNFKTTIKDYFFEGKSIKEKDVHLKRIDSISIFAKLKIPTKINSIKLTSGSKNKYNAKISYINKNIVILTTPIEHYKNLAKIQGIDSLGNRMKVKSQSAFPILKITQNIKNNLNNLRQNYAAILKESSPEKIKKIIHQITKEQFESVHQILALNKHLEDFKKMNKKETISTMFDMIEGYEHLFTSDSQLLKVKFPNIVESVELFFNTEYKEFSTTKVVRYRNIDYYDTSNPFIQYQKTEEGKTKTGIVNKRGEIIIADIIPNDKSFLTQKGNKYFKKTTYGQPDKDSLFWLDVKNKRLVHLNNFDDFDTEIKPNYDVFTKKINEKELYGIVKNKKEIILPFEYVELYKYTNFFTAKKQDDSFEIYTLDFKRVTFKEKIKDIRALDEYLPDGTEPNLFTITNDNDNVALIDEKLNLLTSFKWFSFNEIYGNPNYLVATLYNESKERFFDGIINKKAEIIVPIRFHTIYTILDSKNIKYKLHQGDSKTLINFDDFLTKFKK